MRSLKLPLFATIIGALVIASSAEKILFLLPVASRSHVHVFEPLIKALGERGHEVVAVSPILSPNMPPSVKHLQLVTLDDILGKMPNPFEERKNGIISQLMNSSSMDHLDKACVKFLTHPKLQTELLDKEKFDLIIVDIFLNYCALGLIPKFNTSSIYISTLAAPSAISNVVGNRLPLSIVPNLFMPYSDKMSFKERFINAVCDFGFSLVWDRVIVKKAETLYREHLPNGDKLPSIDDIQANVSMLFMNSHFTLNHPRPLLPDVIEVGGMHTHPAKKLPKDLDDFCNGAGKDGFIFFSLGSVVKPTEMSEETRKKFVKVFAKLKQRVLWKWGTESMPDLPPNVMLRKWLPQQDILGHPNIKLFMTHGGLLSTQESVYHGVPVLGLPVFGDQDLNIKQAEKGGYAKFVEIVDMSKEKLEEAILELINNPSYAEKVKTLSKLTRDLPESPLDKAVYWTEYVMSRERGKMQEK